MHEEVLVGKTKLDLTAALAGNGRTVKGKVMACNSEKTIRVQVDRSVKHPKYRKFVVHSRTLQVHDPAGHGKVGDLVTIKEIRPVSKSKSWALLSVDSHDESASEPVAESGNAETES